MPDSMSSAFNSFKGRNEEITYESILLMILQIIADSEFAMSLIFVCTKQKKL